VLLETGALETAKMDAFGKGGFLEKDAFGKDLFWKRLLLEKDAFGKGCF
jgi:hypothetical protein